MTPPTPEYDPDFDIDPLTAQLGYHEITGEIISTEYTADVYRNFKIVFSDYSELQLPSSLAARMSKIRLGVSYTLAFAGKDIVGIKETAARPWLWRLPQEYIDKRCHEATAPEYFRRYRSAHEIDAAEASLPDWLKSRLDFFRIVSPRRFLDFWDVEVEICHLAAQLLAFFDRDTAAPHRNPDKYAVVKDFNDMVHSKEFTPKSPFTEWYSPDNREIVAAWNLAVARYYDASFDAAGTPAAYTTDKEFYQ